MLLRWLSMKIGRILACGEDPRAFRRTRNLEQEVVDFRAASPFIDEDFNGEWQMFTPRPADAPRGVGFGKFSLATWLATLSGATATLPTTRWATAYAAGPLSETVIINYC